MTTAVKCASLDLRLCELALVSYARIARGTRGFETKGAYSTIAAPGHSRGVSVTLRRVFYTRMINLHRSTQGTHATSENSNCELRLAEDASVIRFFLLTC